MRAIITSVGFGDYLRVTLPYNRHHFVEVWVVTTMADLESTVVARENECKVWQTDAFTRRGEPFNKYAALEEGLDAIGRSGWLCLLDADVLLPKQPGVGVISPGNLYCPLRRMWFPWQRNEGRPFPPPEDEWQDYPRHPLHARMPEHFSGYCQIFHAEDSHLGAPPWHRLDLPDAGAGDTYLMERWPVECRSRPPFEVLHLGDNQRRDWRGRVTSRIG